MPESALPIPKRQKVTSPTNMMDGLSSLPDAILCHILSFLPTKIAVATSMLSTRWRYLWTCVPILEFHDKQISVGVGQRDNKAMKFFQLVSTALILNKVQALKAFRLTCGKSSCEPFQVGAWLTSAVNRNVEQLELSFNRVIRESITLPQHIFTHCHQLVILKLKKGIFLNVANSPVHFPLLKCLHLEEVCFSSMEHLNDLLSGCPVLEDLYILHPSKRYLWSASTSSQIRIRLHKLSSLKRLTMVLSSNSYTKFIDKVFIEIDTPMLEHLHLQCCFFAHYSFGSLPKLKKAYLDFKDQRSFSDCNGVLLIDLMEGVQHVNFLSLCPHELSTLWSLSGHSLPIFNNLVCLEFAITSTIDLVCGFIRMSPKLEVLTVKELEVIDRIDWEHLNGFPACFSSTLKLVTLREFKGSEDEMKLIKYVLEKATVLERMSISAHKKMRLEDELRIVKSLSRVRRASAACELVFNEEIA